MSLLDCASNRVAACVDSTLTNKMYALSGEVRSNWHDAVMKQLIAAVERVCLGTNMNDKQDKSPRSTKASLLDEDSNSFNLGWAARDSYANHCVQLHQVIVDIALTINYTPCIYVIYVSEFPSLIEESRSRRGSYNTAWN